MNDTNNKHSHNDYMNQKIIFHALNKGYNILEADVICINDNLYLSHSWRPHKKLTYGPLSKYFAGLELYSKKEIYLYIEIKTSDLRTISLVTDLINEYHGKIKILIKGIDKWFSPSREYIADEIHKNNKNKNVQLYDEFKVNNEIKRDKLFKGSKYRWWNRW